MGADVCLISPASRANEPTMPFGLLYVGAYLQKYGGLKVEIVDLKSSAFRPLSETTKERLERTIVQRVGQSKPSLVGITCLVSEVKEALRLSAGIKTLLPDTVVAVGGIHPTMYPGDLLHSGSSVDYVVIGEGEATFTELARALSNRQGVQEIRGIAWLDEQAVHRTPARGAIEEMDSIPFPLYEQIDTNYYFRPGINIIRNMFLSTAQIFTSRGCPSQCTFCVNKNLQNIMGLKKPYRQRSVKNVVDEIEYLSREYGVDGFYLCDDAFCVRKEWTFGFCEELARRKLDLIWGTETKVNLVTREMIGAMKEAGCVQLDFGVESGSPEVLKRMRKGITLDQVRSAFRWCHELRVRPMANFMFNTPGETEDDVQNTLALAGELDACYYNFGLMVPFPGTDIYELVQPKLTIEEYSIFTEAKRTLSDPRFKFAQHDFDLDGLVWKAHLSFNSLRRRVSFLGNRAYLKRLLRSRRKREYVLALLEVFRKVLEYYWTSLIWTLRNVKSSGD